MGRIIWRESDTLEIELNPNKHLLHFYANQMLGFAWGRRRGVRRMITWSCQEKVLRNCLMVHFHCVELGGPLLKHMYKFSFRIIFFFLSFFLSLLPSHSLLPSVPFSLSLPFLPLFPPFFLSFPFSLPSLLHEGNVPLGTSFRIILSRFLPEKIFLLHLIL